MSAVPHQTNPQEKVKETRLMWGIIIGGLLFVLALWVGIGYLASTRPDPGVFGDMFGAANALFSGLAFACLISALWLQRIELQLQREELSATRAEVRGQKEQLEAQNRTLRRQGFENTFFQLLRLHNEFVRSEVFANSGPMGRDGFRVLFNALSLEYDKEKRGDTHPSMALIHQLNGVYMRVYSEYEAQLGHYFRSLYNIVKLVHESDVEGKRLYTNLVRAQLSSYELLLIFYDSLSEMGREKFKPLIVEYDLLKHLPIGDLLDQNHASL